MKQVLMIIPFFPPMGGGGVYRPLSFVKYLGGHGWQPTVIAPRGDTFWIHDDGLAAQVPESVEANHTPSRVRGDDVDIRSDGCQFVRSETVSAVFVNQFTI